MQNLVDFIESTGHILVACTGNARHLFFGGLIVRMDVAIDPVLQTENQQLAEPKKFVLDEEAKEGIAYVAKLFTNDRLSREAFTFLAPENSSEDVGTDQDVTVITKITMHPFFDKKMDDQYNLQSLMMLLSPGVMSLSCTMCYLSYNAFSDSLFELDDEADPIYSRGFATGGDGMGCMGCGCIIMDGETVGRWILEVGNRLFEEGSLPGLPSWEQEESPELRVSLKAWEDACSVAMGPIFADLVETAFKQAEAGFYQLGRRALQVHPDKGGSKEAFHSVYQAFETLADSEARKKHDNSLATWKVKVAPQPRSRKRKKKAAASRTNAGTFEASDLPKQPTTGTGAEKTSASLPDRQIRLLERLHRCLQNLPRDVRLDVIKQDFSQKQRLILEKWMVDKSSQAPEAPAPSPSHDSKQPLCEPYAAVLSSCGTVLNRPKIGTEPSRKNLVQRKAGGKKTGCNKRKRSLCGSVRKTGGSNSNCYVAMIYFDGIGLITGKSDLPTALEFVVILTAVKQKMLAPTRTASCFQQSLQDALVYACREQGKDCADLDLRFCVALKFAALLGPGNRLQSPIVYSIENLAKLRSSMNPFREYSKNVSSSLFWWYSPEHMQDAWKRLQMAVSDAWTTAGVDSTQALRRIRAWHDASKSTRDRHLRFWERHHMALQDKIKHRPQKLRPNYVPRQDCDDPVHAVKKLLVIWGVLLEKKAQRAEKERRKAFQKKAKAQKDRLAELKRKREHKENASAENQVAQVAVQHVDLHH
eukprot:s664_g8.t3